MKSNRLAPNSIYRKTSAKNFTEDYRKKLQSGCYRDQTKQQATKKTGEESAESSIEIYEDKEELDEKNEQILSDIERQYRKEHGEPPLMIDGAVAGRPLRTIRTANVLDKKDLRVLSSTVSTNKLPPVS